jgi:hypothetical protein
MKVTVEFSTFDKGNEEIYNEIVALQTILDALTDIEDDFEIEVVQKLSETANTKPEQPWRPNIYGDGIRTEKPPYTTINNFARDVSKDAFGRVIDSLIDESKYGKG